MAVRTFTMPTPLGDTLNTKLSSSGTDNPVPKGNQNDVGTNGSQQQQPKGITFAGQDSLAKLPIPDLQSSCDKYLESLKPLQSPREHQDTTAAVREFLKADGPELNERLRRYATGKTSYIEQFCKAKLAHVQGKTLMRL
jgi:carnitine O-acetyltransferase